MLFPYLTAHSKNDKNDIIGKFAKSNFKQRFFPSREKLRSSLKNKLKFSCFSDFKIEPGVELRCVENWDRGK